MLRRSYGAVQSIGGLKQRVYVHNQGAAAGPSFAKASDAARAWTELVKTDNGKPPVVEWNCHRRFLLCRENTVIFRNRRKKYRNCGSGE